MTHPTTKLKENETMLQLLENQSVFFIKSHDKGNFYLDGYHETIITKEQLLTLANELKELANVN